MEDFKSQLIKDMAAFHNTAEFAQKIKLWYQEKPYIVPAIIDHSGAEDRKKRANDYAEGIYRANCLVYIALCDLGFVPQKDRNIEIEESGAASMYRIEKADCEDGEIILELELMDE